LINGPQIRSPFVLVISILFLHEFEPYDQ